MLVVVAVPSVGDANGHVELSNLVSVLARSWNFDGTCPVEIEEAEHPIYHRENNDLHTELTITAKEAKDGCRKIIKALDPTKKPIEITIPSNVYSYEKEQKHQESHSQSDTPYDNHIRISGKGWPIRNARHSESHPDVYLYGDLIVKIKVLKGPSKKWWWHQQR